MRIDAIRRTLAKLGKEPGAIDDGPRAAVAAILRESGHADGTELFFIRRAEHPQDPWSGHIAFPGGRRDPGDETLLATAIRETKEEVGIDLGSAELIARLPDVPAYTRTKRSRMVVAPFVFALPSTFEFAPIAPNEEVSATLWVPLAKFARGEGKGIFQWPHEGQMLDLPCFRLDPGQHVLWGMTYRMLETMLDALGEPQPA